ncbi:MAG: Homocysteine S-methyltransferase [Friedmanniella sp.]|nr:Homocysteine S-methyltransferase [Friedmanniella sp.]
MTRTPLREALRQGPPVVLDGGLATELEAQGHDLSSTLWSARLLAEAPEAVVAAHAAYFAAGAQVATTASYQASFAGLAAQGHDPAELLTRSVRLADRARQQAGGGDLWVAASVGPYGAALADGSEYRGDYGQSVAELAAWHRPRLEVLAAAGPDVLALETIPCLAEVEALLLEVARLDLPCWLSLTCADGRTRAGEPVAEAYAMAADVPQVLAVGVNCTHPREVDTLVESAAASGKPVVVYPNSGEDWDAVARRWTGSPALAPGQVQGWVADGARLVGGCCRVGPEQIRAVAEAVRGSGVRGPEATS